jgi:TolA-binding protein
MENLTLTDFQTTVVVLLAIFSALAVIDKGVAAFKNMFLKGGNGMEKRIKTIEEKQARDYTRINDINRQMRRMDDDMEHVLNAMNAILMHEITGNGVDRLKEAKSDLDTYMSKRGTNAGSQRENSM